LVALWGLPDAIVEAIALHHDPGLSDKTGFCPLTAVHVADALHALQAPGIHEAVNGIDLEYLRRIGSDARLDAWRARCGSELFAGTTP
jgi:hypothetical protein